MTIYDLAQRTENLTLHLNTTVLSVVVEGRTLRSVQCRVANAEVNLSLGARVFIDCTGDGERIREVSVCLSNRSGRPKEVGVRAMRVNHIWDYRVADAMEIDSGNLTVQPGEQQWVAWEINPEKELPEEGYVRFDLLSNPDVVCQVAGAIEPGHVSAFEMGPGKMRRYSSGVTLALRVDPPQSSFAAKNLIGGQTRPYADLLSLWANRF